MTESATVEQFIGQILSADPIISAAIGDRLYNGGAPDDPGYPLVQYMSMAPADIYGVGSCRIATKDVYVVEVVGYECGWAAVDPFADRIDALLHGQHLALTSGWVLSCLRQSPIRRVEFDSGIKFYHAGGMYKTLVRPND